MAEEACLRTYDDAASAELSAARLEEAGIRVRIVGAKLVNPFVYGGVRLFVASTDVERAVAILGPDHALDLDPADDDDPAPRCPRCESAYVNERWSPSQLAVGITLGLVPLLFMKKSAVVCQTCDFNGHASELVTAQKVHDYRSIQRREGNPVFRLRRADSLTGVFLGVLSGGVLAAIDHAGALYFIALGPLAGALFAHALRRDVCSKPGCRALLPKNATECPRCGGQISGAITKATEHFARKAAWHRRAEELDDL